MAYVNTYQPPPPPKPAYGLHGPVPYDINIAFPLDFTQLETPRLKLVPFIPSIHAAKYHAAIPDPAHFYRYFPVSGIEDPESYLLFMDAFVRQNPHNVLLAIIDTTTPDPNHPEWGGVLAGTVALIDYSPTNLSVEIGALCILPAFQRTHVTTHAVGTLLKYCLTTPCASQSESGLGLRRVYWYGHPDNEPSLRLATRMGLKREGTLRWTWVLPVGKLGKTPRKNDPQEGPGRDTVIMAITWEDWEDGARELVTTQMARVE
ncbi:acyl-CoA N-acyltransferase [Suillus clintonianus]|uniref:acyl-CoA N-acyltransferase n=1 Tax=Suillus clintonianus TaxID=1904413 RepID=UPI001B862F98|nr:acyl-CoA N-acyltransferase [Suillus clintonianus]KAG2147558.1 acyl-CoA N-acyltransferase [Suillus clintonianus]